MTDTTITKHKRRTARELMATQAGTKDNAVAQAEKGKENTGPNPLKPSKIDEVLQLLKRTGGATLDELVEATNWLSSSANMRVRPIPLRMSATRPSRCRSPAWSGHRTPASK